MDNSAKEIEKTSNEGDYAIKDELKNELEETLAGQIATNIDDNNTITPSRIRENTGNSIQNESVVSSIEQTLKIKISIKEKIKKLKKDEKLSNEDKAKLFASTQTINSLKLTIKVKKITSVTNFNDFYNVMENKANEAYQQKIDDLETQLNALKLSYVDLSKKFDSDNFNNNVINNVKIINNIHKENYVKLISIVQNTNKIAIINDLALSDKEQKEEDKNKTKIKPIPKISEETIKEIKFPLPEIDGLPSIHKNSIKFKLQISKE